MITRNLIKKQGTVPSGIKLVDGLEISEAGGVIQRDRMQLATEGICIVTITISSRNGSLTSKPDIITRGFMRYDNYDRTFFAKENSADNDLDVDAKKQMSN